MAETLDALVPGDSCRVTPLIMVLVLYGQIKSFF